MDFFTIKNLDTGEILPITDVNETCFFSETTEEALQRVQPLLPLTTMFGKVEDKRTKTGENIYNSNNKDKQSNYTNTTEYEEEMPFLSEEHYAAQLLFPSQIFNRDARYKQNLTFEGITGHSTVKNDKGGPFVVYFLEVQSEGTLSSNNWRIYRRYQEFRKLNVLLRRLGYRVPIFPPKKILKRMEENFVNRRQVLLDNWLKCVLKMNEDDIIFKDPLNSLCIKRFLLEKANEAPLSLEQELPSPDQNIRRNKFIDEMNLFGKKKIGLGDFELIRVIGCGSFGKVMLVRKEDTGSLFAMKGLNKQNVVQRKQVEHTQTERNVLAKINHPFIVKLHFAFQTKKKLFLILDYCSGGELFFHLVKMRRFPETMVRFYSAEIVLALEHLHKNQIIYRDLKPENILLDQTGHIKLADFGLAKEGVSDPSTGAFTICGTPEYICPEILSKKGYGTAADWWTLGMVLYEMLTGLPPWYTPDRRLLFDQIKNADLSIPSNFSIEISSLIRGLLTRNPNERLGSITDSGEIKAHSFYEEIDWDALLLQQIPPPFNPCPNDEIEESANFGKEFTRLRLYSDDNTSFYYGRRQNNFKSNLFNNFSFVQDEILNDNLTGPSINI